MGRRFFSSFLVCSNLELRTFVQSYYTKLLGRGLQFYYKLNCDRFELILKIQKAALIGQEMGLWRCAMCLMSTPLLLK